ncbi:MAG: hypothetical protein ACLRM8_02105 [Alistipes sp.]
MFRKLTAAILSVILLSPGWLGATGLTLPFALVPLLWISSSYDASRRSWRRMFGWAALTSRCGTSQRCGGYGTRLRGSRRGDAGFDVLQHDRLHVVSHGFEKGPKALAYTLLVAGWIATEYWYTVGEFRGRG